MRSIFRHIEKHFPLAHKLLQPLRIQKYYLTLRLKSPESIFERMYQTNGWGSSESVSGHGSELGQTIVIRGALPSLLQRFGCQSMLDVPCGDFNWMKEVAMDLDYTGADIVPALIESNQHLYGSRQRRFIRLDLLSDKVPMADLVLCRDCLVHLSNSSILNALTRIKESGSKYLLTTTFTNVTENVDIPTGAWRAINLTKPPFTLPEPVCLIREDAASPAGYEDKSLGLWRLQDLVIGR